MSVGLLYPSFSGATLSKCGEKEALADYGVVALLAEFCNGKKQEKNPPHLHDSVDKISVSINKEKIIKQ